MPGFGENLNQKIHDSLRFGWMLWPGTRSAVARLVTRSLLADMPQGDIEQQCDVLVVQAVIDDLPVPPAPDEVQVLEPAQLVRHGRLSHPQGRGQIARFAQVVDALGVDDPPVTTSEYYSLGLVPVELQSFSVE